MTDDTKTISQLSALAQETRLSVFRALMQAGPAGMPAGEIAQRLDVAPTTLSSHLGILNRSGLIDMRRNGRSLIYSANVGNVRGLIQTLVSDCCNGHPDVCSEITAAAEINC